MEDTIDFHISDVRASSSSSAILFQSANDGLVTSKVSGANDENVKIKYIVNSANEEKNLQFINRGEQNNSDFEFRVNKAVSRIIELIYSDDFVEGESSKTQLYMEYLYHKDKGVFLESFNRSWVELYTHESYYIMTFLNVASTISYDWLGYRADSIVMGFNSIDDPYVNEAAIRAIESWEQKSHIHMLERMRVFDKEWIEQYKNDVIEYLREL